MDETISEPLQAEPASGGPSGNESAGRPSDLVQDDLPGGIIPKPTIEEIEEAMRDVVDPELMVNVVDLGLVYGIQVDDEANVTIDMTLTSPTCPLTDRIEYDTQYVLEGLVNSVTINWVWLPPWTLDVITEEGREQLRAIGFNV